MTTPSVTQSKVAGSLTIPEIGTADLTFDSSVAAGSAVLAYMRQNASSVRAHEITSGDLGAPDGFLQSVNPQSGREASAAYWLDVPAGAHTVGFSTELNDTTGYIYIVEAQIDGGGELDVDFIDQGLVDIGSGSNDFTFTSGGTSVSAESIAFSFVARNTESVTYSMVEAGWSEFSNTIFYRPNASGTTIDGEISGTPTTRDGACLSLVLKTVAGGGGGGRPRRRMNYTAPMQALLAR